LSLDYLYCHYQKTCPSARLTSYRG